MTATSAPTSAPPTTTDIRLRLGIEAPRADVHRALATIDGLASWWTRDTEGDAGVGGHVQFQFGGPDRRVVVDVEQVTPDRIVWRCVHGPDEWLDTTFTFDLSHDDGETVLFFTHGGW